MIALAQIVARLFADLAGLVVLSVRSRRSVDAEKLFLRRQLSLYRERGVRPRRVDAATRVSLALLSRLIDWRDVLVVVRLETLIRWHRAGWRLFWRMMSRPGRPPPHSPKVNAICERVIGTIRRECLDWLIPLSESHLRSILGTWAGHDNRGRPHMVLVRACRTLHCWRSSPRQDEPAIESASASRCAPDRCWAARITGIGWRPRRRDRVIAEHSWPIRWRVAGATRPPFPGRRHAGCSHQH